MDNKVMAETVLELRAHLDESGLAVFPAIFDDPDLVWPDDDWRAFLDVAVKAGARVIYLEECTDGDYVIEQCRQARDRLSDEAHTALAAAESWEGPVRIELGFIAGGARHLYSVEADWLDALDAAVVNLLDPVGESFDDVSHAGAEDDGPPGDEGGRHRHLSLDERDAMRIAEANRVGPTVEAWVARLAEDPAILAAPSQAARRRIAEDLIPELTEWRTVRMAWADPEGAARHDATYEALRRLEPAVTAVKEARVAAAREQLDTWAADLAGTGDYRAATNADMRRRTAGTFVAGRLGFPSTDIRDRLLAALRP